MGISARWGSPTQRTPRWRSPVSNPPGLKAMYIDCGGFSNAYQGGIRQGGAFELKQVTWAYNNALESPEVQKDPRRRGRAQEHRSQGMVRQHAVEARPHPLEPHSRLRDVRLRAVGARHLRRLLASSSASTRPARHGAFADAATVHLSGWYDPYARTATENYQGLARAKRGPVRLIMGPWTHGDRSRYLLRRCRVRRRRDAGCHGRRSAPVSARAGSTV